MKAIKSDLSGNGRLLSIDALRGIAALGVVLYHAVLQTTNAVPNNFFRWPVKALQFVSSFGYVGVFLFFVISGFCIHLQWTRSRVEQESRPIKFVPFWKRRVRRLYPPYVIALVLFFVLTALTTGITVTRFFVYDVVMHLLMLHNMDPATVYSVNGVFWTLAIEEQLYLAYFLLLFMRARWGWGTTLIVCASARLGWFFFTHWIWTMTAIGIPVPEGALSHWFTWALGAVAVEAWFGLIQLPRWCLNLWLGSMAIVAGAAISLALPFMPKDSLLHDGSWLLLHPLWGFGFFVVVNCAVNWERRRASVPKIRISRAVTLAASIGLFSYSLYLTHELVIMQSWRFYIFHLPPILSTLFLAIPATVLFAWIFFRYCERPYLRKASARKEQSPPKADLAEEIFPQTITLVEEG